VRHGHAQRGTLGCDDLAQRGGEDGGLGRGVGTGVGDPEATAEVELAQLDARLAGELRVQPESAPGRDLEAFGVEDLGADVGVDADQIQVGVLEAGL
jgi:hypothetical protein